MPVLDHYHLPLSRRSWESFHSSWAVYLRDALKPLLPRGYFLEVQAHQGPLVEIDVAALEEGDWPGPGNGSATAAVAAPARVWVPAAPPRTVPAEFPGAYAVRVFHHRGGPKLVAAIELVSPANKDRPRNRQAFAAKCAHYLSEGIGLIVVDLVTTRKANLHNLVMKILKHGKRFHMAADETLYAAAYRPLRRRQKKEIDFWTVPLKVGGALPTLPLSLDAEISLPVDLEATYQETCRREL